MADSKENIKKLHKNLTERWDGFNVSYEQFEADMQDEEKLSRLHSNLTEKWDGFNVPIEQFKIDMSVGGGSMGKPNIPSASSGGESPSSPSKGFDTDYYIRQAPSATEIDTTQSQTDPTKKEDVKNKFIGKTAEYYNNAYSNVTKELEGLEADVDSIKERRAELEIMRDRLAKTPQPMPSVGAGYRRAAEGYNQNIQAINDEINGLNTAVNDYNKAVKEKSLERYTIAQDKVAYDSYIKQQESDAIKGMWDEMPLTQFVGGKVIGGFLYGMNQIAGSVLMDAATKGPTMTQAEINNIESEELRILFQENRNKQLKEAKKFYDKALEFQESSEAAKRNFGLVSNLEEIESPLDVVNFAVTSMSEQFPQIPLAVATMGLGTLSQTSGHIMSDIIKEKVSEYEKEGKTSEEAFKLAVESDDINRAAVTGASIAVAGLDLLGATKLIGGIGKKVAAESLKDSFISAGAKTFIKGTTTEVVTEVAQEYIEAEGKGLAVGKDFLEGASEITVDDALNIVAKTLFGAGGFSAVNAYTEQGKVNKENAEMLRKASENEATRTLLEERITAQKIAGEITEEQANERISQLADDIEIMSSIPKEVAEEDMLEAYDLVKKYNQAKADQEQASSAFRGLYNEEIKGYEEKLQSLVGKKQEQQSETSTHSKQDSESIQEPPTGDESVQEEVENSFDNFYQENYDDVVSDLTSDGAEPPISEVITELERRARKEGINVNSEPILSGKINKDAELTSVNELGEFVGEDRVGRQKTPQSRKNIDKLKQDIKENGFNEPIIVQYTNDGKASIVEGNHRYAAAVELGYDKIPVSFRRVDNLPKGVSYSLLKNTPSDQFSKTGEDLGFTTFKKVDSDYKQKQDAKKQQSGEMREQGEPQETKGTSDINLSEVNETELQDGTKEATATLKLKPEQEITYKSGEETLSGKVVEDLGETISIETPNGSEVIIEKSDLVSRPKTPKQKSVSVESETQGLTPKQQAKQGVTEIVESYKGRIKEIRSTMNERIKQAKQVARDKAKAIREAQKSLDDFVKETIPKTEKISRGLARKIANARTDKAVENAMDAIENYLEKSAISKEKNNIRENQKKVAKKLKSTSEYTNKERVVSEFLAGLDLNSISDINTLSEIARVMSDLANKPIANVRESEIKAISSEPTIQEQPPIKKETIDRSLAESVNESKTIKQRAISLGKATRAINNLIDAGEDVSELEAKLIEATNRLNEDTKDEVKDLNKDSESMLRSVDTSDMSPAQKEMVKQLKSVKPRLDYLSAKLLNDIALELSFGYAPIKNMQEYISKAYSEEVANKSVPEIDNAATKRKTKLQQVIGKTWVSKVVPDFLKKKGVDSKSLEQVIRTLSLSPVERWDDLLGMGRTKPIQKYVISPIERGITATNEMVKERLNSLNKVGRISPESGRKIVMAMTQGYWDLYRDGADYWGELLSNDKFKAQNESRWKQLKSDYDSMPKKSDGKVDYESYLNNLSKKDAAVYEWIVENNKKMSDLQRVANERRGQKYEEIDNRYYIPMKRQSDSTNPFDGDSYVENIIKMIETNSPKLKSDRGEVRVSAKIQDLNVDLYSLIADQVLQTSRDYNMTETVKTSLKTLSKIASRVQDQDAKKYLDGMKAEYKSRLAEEFGKQKASGMGLIDVPFRFLYQYVLMGARLAPEMGAETIRMSTAANAKYFKDALKLRASSIKNKSLQDILEFTNSPFVSNLYFENMETLNQRKLKRNSFIDKMGEVNQKILSAPDSMTFNIVWTPSFLEAFEQINGSSFDVDAFIKNPQKYLSSNKKSVNEAASIADSKTQALKGAKTRFGRRRNVKVLPDWLVKIPEILESKRRGAPVKFGATPSSSALGKLITTLQNFAFLEQFNIANNFNEMVYGENKNRDAATIELIGALLAGTFYTIATSTLYALTLDDEDEMERELERLRSPEGLFDSFISNAIFLASGRYGNIGKAAMLLGIGMYDVYLKKNLGRSDYKKQSQELKDWTRGRYFADPIDLGGYKSEADIMDAFAPFIGRTISLVTQSTKGTIEGISDVSKGDADTKAVIKLVSDMCKLYLMTRGVPLPFQKEVDKRLRDVKKKKKQARSSLPRLPKLKQ